MEIRNILSADISEADANALYDTVCKNILSTKIILAWILKGCADEFKDLDVHTIADLIENEPLVSSVGVMPNTTNSSKIHGIANEDASINEGIVVFDIIFTAVTPSNDRIRMIINVEAQNNYHPGYPIQKRGIFYGCRMISSQYGREFENSHYEDIKKVYTIWICTYPPKQLQNKIHGYSIQPFDVIGKVEEDRSVYDLMTCIMVYLGENEDDDPHGLLRLLEVLLMPVKTPEEKKEILENDYNIEMSEKLDE